MCIDLIYSVMIEIEDKYAPKNQQIQSYSERRKSEEKQREYRKEEVEDNREKNKMR